VSARVAHVSLHAAQRICNTCNCKQTEAQHAPSWVVIRSCCSYNPEDAEQQKRAQANAKVNRKGDQKSPAIYSHADVHSIHI